MGGIASGIGSLFGGGETGNLSGVASGLEGLSGAQAALAPEFQGISSTLQNLGSTLTGQAQDIYNPAYSQYLAGASGQLTPAMQSLVTQNLGQMNLGTQGAYSNLGLGGSTMEGQDLASNQLRDRKSVV